MASTSETSASVVSSRAAPRRDPRAWSVGFARRIPPIILLILALALGRFPTAVAGETPHARGVGARATSRWSADEASRGRVSARWLDAGRSVGPADSGSEEESGSGAALEPEGRPSPISFHDDVEVSNVSAALELPRRVARKLAAASSTSAKSIVAGYHNTFAIMDDDSVMCWGSNTNGALGVGSSGGKSYVPVGPIDLGAGRTAKMVSAGGDEYLDGSYTCAILDDDTLKCWGGNGYGQLGYGDTTDRSSPEATAVVNLGSGHKAKMVSTGGNYNTFYTCAILDDDTLKCWGGNAYGQLGYGDTTQRTSPEATAVVNLGSGRKAKMVSAGNRHTCAILDDDTLKCWGGNGNGQLGYGDTTGRTSPDPTAVVNLGSGRKAKMVSVGPYHSCAILDDDTLKCWGNNAYGQLGYGDTTGRTSPEATAVVDLGSGRKAKMVSAGEYHSCAVLDDDTLKCWGGNGEGQLGIGGLPSSASVDFGSGRTVKSASTRGTHTCAVLSDDSTWCWGYNGHGQVGEGSITARFYLPSEVRFSSSSSTPPPSTGSPGAGTPEPPGPRAPPAKSIVAGSRNTFAIMDDDSVMCWGSNEYGALGVGSSGGRSFLPVGPIDLGAGRTAKMVSAGYYHACAILDDDTLKCWGNNAYGQLGYGDTTDRSSPEATAVVNLGSGHTAKMVSAAGGRSYAYTCAILDDDTLKCWGGNAYGQLGYGDTTQRTRPEATAVVNLGSGRTAKMVSTAESHICAILDDDTLKCWGYNGNGELGYGDNTPRLSPEATAVVDLGSGHTAKMVSVQGDDYGGFTCAVLDDDTIKCWGDNESQRLGYGGATSVRRNRPDATAVVNLGSGRTAKTVSAGDAHACAVLDDDTLKCWGYNDRGQLGTGGLTSSNSVDFGSGRTVKSASAGLSHTCAVLSDDSTWCWGGNSNGEVGDGSTTSDFFLPSEVRFSSSSSTPSPSTGSPGAGTAGPPGPRAPPAPGAPGAPPGPSGPPGPPGSGVGAGAVLATEDAEGSGSSNRGGAVVALAVSVAATVFIV